MKTSGFWVGLYMALIGGNWIAYHLILPLRIAHHILLTAFLVYFLWKRGLPDTPMLLPLGALAAAVALSGVNAIDRRMALEYGWHWLTNWLLFLYLIDALRDGQDSAFFKAVFLAGGLLAASCLVEWLLSMGTARPAGMFGVINLTGAFLAALMVPAVAWTLTAKSDHRWLLAASIPLMGFAILLNQSRGPLLSIFVALALFGILTLHTTWLKIALGSVLAGFGLIIVIVMSNQAGHNSGDVVRLDLWKAGGQMLADYPTGVGAGLFPQAYHPLSVSGDHYTGAHNFYINLGAELGAPGLAASAAFFLVGLYFLIGQKRTIRENAVLAALVGVMAQLAADNYPAQNWTFLLSLYAAYLLREVRFFNQPIPPIFKHLLIYTLLVYGLLFANWDIAQIHYEKALQLHSLDEAEIALAFDSHNRLYALEVERFQNPSLVISSDFAITNFARVSY